MKKILAILLCSVVVLSACNKKGDESSQISSDIESGSSTFSESSEQNQPEPINWDEYPLVQFETPKVGAEIATMSTSMGDIKIMFFPELAPKAVENFVTHAKNGYYNNLKFHRVMPEFMIQGGDPDGTGRGGDSIWQVPFEDEFSLSLYNFRGALSMANSGTNTNGSQFFIVNKSSVEAEMLEQMKSVGYSEEIINKYKEIGGTPWLDGMHTVFGYVIEGMDVVDAIANVKTTADVPDADVTIKSITFEIVK